VDGTNFRLVRSAAMKNAIAANLAVQLLEQAEILERATQILHDVQAALPAPSAKEVAALRRGGSISVAAYLSGLLQRVIVNVENAASDLRAGMDEETLSVLDELRLSAVEINAIESALSERLTESLRAALARAGHV
jgi:hypothetical protein